MSYATLDAAPNQSRAWSRSRKRVLNAIARQRVERDSGRVSHLAFESRPRVLDHEIRFRHDSPAGVTFSAHQRVAADRLPNAEPGQPASLAGGTAPDSSRTLPPDLHAPIAASASLRSMHGAMPMAARSVLRRMAAAHVDAANDNVPLHRGRIRELPISERLPSTHDAIMSVSLLKTSSIGGRLPRSTSTFRWSPEHAVSASLVPGLLAARSMRCPAPGAVIRPSSRAVSQKRLHISRQSASRENGPHSRPYRYETDVVRSRASRNPSHFRAAETLLSSLHNGFADGGVQYGPRNSPLNFDGEGSRSAIEQPLSTATANESAQQAIAIVANELERLRTAIRHTIDDLERARGPVPSALPALPPSRGAFRLS